MQMLFVMDPIESVNIKKDTTFAFLTEAQRRGHECWVCELDGLSAEDGRGWARGTPVTVRDQVGNHVTRGEPARRPLDDFGVVWMRKDPPFDMSYLYATYILELVDTRRTLVINRPSGLRAANEKAYTMHFPEVTPLSIITRDAGEIRRFVADQLGRAVLKPLDRMGGSGIFLLRADDANYNSIVEQGTRGGEEFVIVQQFVPEAAIGDKRIVLMDGEPLGAILRVPAAGEFRGNMAVGGTAKPTTITERDRDIIDAVVPRLRADGLWFVGLDVIGSYLTEVNVTSPTGIQEIDRFGGVHAEERVIDWAEKHAPKGGRKSRS